MEDQTKQSHQHTSTRNKGTRQRALKTVTRKEEAFYFFTGVGNFTGKLASSLTDFRDQLKTINIESVNFHYSRQDFEKWIKETLGDAELAKQISGIKGLKGEALRGEILRKVDMRIKELKVQSPLEQVM